jgi:hypothetical protein
MEGQISVLDLTEVVDQHMVRKSCEEKQELEEVATCGG